MAREEHYKSGGESVAGLKGEFNGGFMALERVRRE